MIKCPLPLALLILLGALFPAGPAAGSPAEIWVSPGGSDASPGAIDAPLASLEAALKKWRAWSAAQKNPSTNTFNIILRDGIFPLAQPVLIQTGDTSLRIQAALGEHPVLSGGRPIRNWKKLTATVPGLPAGALEKLWAADIPQFNGHPLEFRQLWVNDKKAVRAREPNGENLARLVAWDKTNEVATIAASTLAGIREPARLEMFVDQVWEIAVLRVKSIRLQNTNAILTFEQPESRIEFQHPWPPVTVSARYQAPFFLANALEFLNEPGEWFADSRAGKIYYWPRDGEDMSIAKVFAPAIETLVQIQGLPEKPVTNISFQGITFAHTTWLRPSQQGHVPLQAGMFLLDAKELSPKGMPYHPGLDNLAWIGRPPAAVWLKHASHISFEDCTFTHLASAGVDFAGGTHADLVQGCVFYDLGANGIQLGTFSETNVETHVPYIPSDPRELCTHEKIANNLISDCANEDWGCVGIGIGYAQNISLEHNEIFNLPYTAISVGWGWTKMTNALRDNFILANRIHHIGQRLGDLGGIYTLSAQPGTVIAENAVSDISPSPFVPDPNHWFYLYLDEGSSAISVRDNWCPAEKFLKNANGPGNLWTNNGPHVSERIKNAAGLEPAFKDLLPQVP